MQAKDPAIRSFNVVLFTGVAFVSNNVWSATVAVRVGLCLLICRRDSAKEAVANEEVEENLEDRKTEEKLAQNLHGWILVYPRSVQSKRSRKSE